MQTGFFYDSSGTGWFFWENSKPLSQLSHKLYNIALPPLANMIYDIVLPPLANMIQKEIQAAPHPISLVNGREGVYLEVLCIRCKEGWGRDVSCAFCVYTGLVIMRNALRFSRTRAINKNLTLKLLNKWYLIRRPTIVHGIPPCDRF